MSSLSHQFYPSPAAGLGLSAYSPYGNASISAGGYGGGGGAGGGGASAHGAHQNPVSSSLFASETSRLLNPEPPSRLLPNDGHYGSSASYLSNFLPSPPQSHLQSLSAWNAPPSASSRHPSSIMHPLEPPLSGLKRAHDEVLYSGEVLSKRPRVDAVANLPVYPRRPGEKDCSFYMRTGTCSFGASCKFDHPTWIPAGGIPDWKEVSAPSSDTETLPVRPGEQDCAFYMKTGSCKYGVKCKFNHPKDKSISASGKNASQQNGTASEVKGTLKEASATTSVVSKTIQAPAGEEGGETKNAPAKPATAFNSKGLPLRPGETDCAFYVKKGSCKYGSTCRFNHPDKKPATQVQSTVVPMLGGFSGGLGYSAAYTGGVSDYGLSTAGSGYGISAALAPNPHLPQRPGDGECPYFMRTGNCKFGASCRFHHPLTRLDPTYVDPGVKLTLAGLPRREGELMCAYYMKTGACKYGSTCKYDHPPPGEAAAKALAEAGKSEQNHSSDSNQISKGEDGES